MARTVPQKGMHTTTAAPRNPQKLLHILLLIAYGYLTVFTPNMNSYDSNGPKFLALALLNLVTFSYLFSRKEMKAKPGWYYGFFGNAMGLAYTGLMVFSLLSFVKAINLNESILHFAKIFSVFSATYLVSVLVKAERRGLLSLAAAMSLLLIYDSITVFSDILELISGKIYEIGKIKSVYSNKNILAAAVFVKIPFAFWLMLFQKKLWRILGLVAVPLAMLAVFFMSSRAFYIGLLMITTALAALLATSYIKSRDKREATHAVLVVLLLLVTLAFFSFIERNHYPKQEPHAQPAIAANNTAQPEERKPAATSAEKTISPKSQTSITGRLSTIKQGDNSSRLRLAAWKRSWHIFRENPLLGVGLGNWKVAVLKEENQTIDNFLYQYKAHNDFIEIPTESGIFAGFCFFAIFGLLFWKFLSSFFKNHFQKGLTWLFLPAMGLFAYSFDAFFNFPQDRPEIQSLFALYAGTAIALTSLSFAGKGDNKEEVEMAEALALPVPFLHRMFNKSDQGTITHVSPLTRAGMIVVFLVIQTASACVLVQNFHSLKLQRIIKQEILRGKLISPADKFLTGFPAIPNLNGEAEPIAVLKARYLINEKRYQEAISLLRTDNASPFDGRKEYFTAMAFMDMKMPDSALCYYSKMYELKPNNFKNISIMTNLMQQQGRAALAEQILERYLEKHPENLEALRYASGFYDWIGKPEKAVAAVNLAVSLAPEDTMVIKQKAYLDRKVVTSLYKATFDAAMEAYGEKRYGESVRLFSEILDEKPDYLEAREYRAFSYFYQRDYNKSNADLDYLIRHGTNRPGVYNLHGVNFYNLGKLDEACPWFKAAMEKGDRDGTNNYNRYCKQTQTISKFPAAGAGK